MCSATMMLAGTAMSAISQIQQGQAAKNTSDASAALDNYQAKVERDNAAASADLYRKAGRRQVSAADAAFGASGVQVGEGSAGEVDRQIYNDSEHDAYMTLLTGERRAQGLQTQGKLTQASGRAAQAASYMNAAGTVLGGAYSAARASGWRTAGPGFAGTQAPAPVEERKIPGT
jgi:hypothetical protein